MPNKPELASMDKPNKKPAPQAPRFPYEQSQWKGDQDDDPRRRWYEALERTGTSAVHARLIQHKAASNTTLSIGTETHELKGFAEEWLAWHVQQRSNRESDFASLKSSGPAGRQ